MNERRFRHEQSGTPETQWLAASGWEDVTPISVDSFGTPGRLIVVSAHPDDETLGAGATIAELAAAGWTVHIVAVTDGEASHPRSAMPAHDLAALRRNELRAAVDELAPDARLTFLNLPDGGLEAREARLREQLIDFIAPGSTVFAPWVDDGHPDHDAAGRAARAVAHENGATLWHFPIWLWQWEIPSNVPWSTWCAISPTPDALHRKDAALNHFPSQTEPLGLGPGDQPVLTDAALARARRAVEVLIPAARMSEFPGQPSKRADFDAMFDDSDDPWGFSTSFYEERHRAIILAALSRPRYDRALDIGCATGELTNALATRCDAVVGVDGSAAALQRAKAKAEHEIEWVRADLPEGVPDGRFDLIVLSEVGYFLTGLEFIRLLQAISARLAPGGELVLAHWQHPTRDIPSDGALVHRHALHQIDLPVRVRYSDDDFELIDWGTGESAASRDGLI